MIIKVASYNIHKAVGTDRRYRPERILEVLSEIGADIIALQEADQRFGTKLSVLPAKLLDHQAEYVPVAYNIRRGGIGWHGNAILVRRSAAVLDCEALHLPTLEPRGAVLADIAIGGTAMRVVGMHLDLSGLRRRHQARSIMAQVDRRAVLPTILMGDLNEWRVRGGCIVDLGTHYKFAPTGPSFHALRPLASLDRIMVSRDVNVAAAGVHNTPLSRQASDHLPVWAQLEFG